MNQVSVTTAVKLSEQQRSAVKQLAADRLSGADYELCEYIEPAVIGGIKVQINSRVYDATVQGKLAALREASR